METQQQYDTDACEAFFALMENPVVDTKTFHGVMAMLHGAEPTDEIKKMIVYMEELLLEPDEEGLFRKGKILTYVPYTMDYPEPVDVFTQDRRQKVMRELLNLDLAFKYEEE